MMQGSSSFSRTLHMGGNTLSDNRALLQVLTHAENMNRSPRDIVRSAIAGGVVNVFDDADNRHSECMLLPSSHDLSTLAVLIAEGFFAPFLDRVLGDQHSRRTLLAESGCFEYLALPVLLFPDCFLTPSLSDLSLCKGPSTALPYATSNSLNTSLDAASMHSGSSISAVGLDIQHLHRLRLQVALLLLKNVNEVLRDAELWKRKSFAQQTTDTVVSGVATANAVMAMFYEVKMLLLCCVASSNRFYTAGTSHDEHIKTPQCYFDEIFDSKDLYRIFEERNRLGIDDMMKWYDTMLDTVTAMMLGPGGGLQDFLSELHTELVESHKVSSVPTQLLHRPHDAVRTNIFCLPFAHAQQPRLEVQPGELVFLFMESFDRLLLLELEPLRLCHLLRRCATVKLTVVQLRDSESLLASCQWCRLHSVVAESVRRHLSDTYFICSMLEKNSSFVSRLVLWLQEAPSTRGSVVNHDKETVDGGDGVTTKNTDDNDDGGGVSGTCQDLEERRSLGMSIANDIIECAILIPPFGASVAQFMRDTVSGGALNEMQLYRWMERLLPEVGNKPPAMIGLFALVVAFSLAQRGWQLPEKIRESSIELCRQHRQQPDCVTLLDLLRRQSV